MIINVGRLLQGILVSQPSSTFRGNLFIGGGVGFAGDNIVSTGAGRSLETYGVEVFEGESDGFGIGCARTSVFAVTEGLRTIIFGLEGAYVVVGLTVFT
mmetsp:Transcript_31675/g.47866  ORF Transcript_31675/g.47866 Transcript_31675/m.47866 type:complete len:99 (-) Transcript_31675:706-1002(-)